MIDIRENILKRLMEIAASIPNVRSAKRNLVDLPEDILPAANIRDGDEESNGLNDIGSSHPPNRDYTVQMTPEIEISEQSDEVGSDIGTLRRELIKRVLTDAVLVGSVGTNGAIRYLGCQTDIYAGRTYVAVLSAQFVFKYVLKIEEL